jgi:hypothetical protein
MTVPEADILTATALMTVVEGEIVYSALADETASAPQTDE